MAEYKMHADLLDWPTELQELRMLQAEALGWQPVAPGAYLHLAQPSAKGELRQLQQMRQMRHRWWR